MTDMLEYIEKYGWLAVLILFVIMNPDRLSKLISPIFPPLFRWLDSRREQEREAEQRREQALRDQYNSAFEIIKETLSWMHDNFSDMDNKLGEWSEKMGELKGTIDKNNSLISLQNIAMTELVERLSARRLSAINRSHKKNRGIGK